MTLEQTGIIVAIATSLAALVVSWRGNAIARTASESANRQFALTNRPRVTVQPLRLDNGKYFKCSQSGNTVVVKMLFEIRNVGNVATEAFQISKDSGLNLVGPTPPDGETHKSALTNSLGFALAPGEAKGLGPVHVHTFPSEKEAIAYFQSSPHTDPKDAVLTELVLAYNNPTDKTRVYQTSAVYSVTLDEAILIKQDYLDLTASK